MCMRAPSAFGGTHMDHEIQRILTRREFDVMECLSTGKSAKETAQILNIAFETVRSHRKHIMEKLHVHSTVAFVRYYIEKTHDIR
jgi:two-component system, NarL family, response regulator NreC